MQLENSGDFSDPDLFADDSEMFDAVIDEALRTNLAARFEDSVSHEQISQDQVIQSSTQNDAATLMDPLQVDPSLPSTQHTDAPLDPRNKYNTGQAGAAVE